MKKYLIKKYDLYYRPNAAGYTSSISEAWKLPYDEAIKYTGSKGQPDEVKIEEAPPCNILDGEDGFYYREGDPLLASFKDQVFRCGWSYTIDGLGLTPVVFTHLEDIRLLKLYSNVGNREAIQIMIKELKDGWVLRGGDLAELTRLVANFVSRY